MIENFAGDDFVNQYAPMLGVILKLDDVIVAVVGFEHMRLSAAPHLADEPARVYRHAERLVVRGPGKEQVFKEERGIMTPEETKPAAEAGHDGTAKNRDEVALELMKFIAVTTGYGKGNTTAAGFSGKPAKSTEEYADALIQLFEKCRAVVAKPVQEER
jgi:hypothetical protein